MKLIIWIKKNFGQSTVEYLALIAIILGVFIGVGTYFKRGMQGRWKSAVDGLGDQYDPRVTNTDYTESQVARSETRVTTIPVNGGIWTMRSDQSNSTDAKIGSSRVGAF